MQTNNWDMFSCHGSQVRSSLPAIQDHMEVLILNTADWWVHSWSSVMSLFYCKWYLQDINNL